MMRVARSPLLLAAGLHLVSPAASAAPPAASVDVVVRNVHDDRGHVLVALCTKSTFLTAGCPYHGSAPARPGTVTVRIEGVAPGTYSAQAFHDVDDTGKLGRTFFGLPDKAMGFSRDARMLFGPPTFADAAFPVQSDHTQTSVTLHYY